MEALEIYESEEDKQIYLVILCNPEFRLIFVGQASLFFVVWQLVRQQPKIDDEHWVLWQDTQFLNPFVLANSCHAGNSSRVVIDFLKGWKIILLAQLLSKCFLTFHLEMS